MFTKSLWEGIEGVIFDAVGTLIEPTPGVAEIYAAAAARQGVDLDPAELRIRFRRFFRQDEVDETRGPLVTDEAIEFARWRRIVDRVLPEVPDGERAFAELWDHFSRPAAWRCFPDVRPAVRTLQDLSLPVRIASNFDRRLRGVVSGLPELGPLFEGMVISSEVGYRKPHESFYVAACASLGLPPARVLSVGDDVENDVKGPARWGLRSVLVDRSGAPSAGLASFRNLTELLATRPPA